MRRPPRAAASRSVVEAGSALDEQLQQNRRRVAVVIGAMAAANLALAVLALILLGVVALVVVLVLGSAAEAYVALAGGPRALRLAGAEPADPVAHAGLHNLAEGLCVVSGLPKPGLYVVADPGANAFAVGRDPNNAALVVTTGLLDVLGRIELEGILAQVLAHVRSGDTAIATVVVAVPFLRRMLDDQRETRADLAAVETTRYPPGLAAALEKMARHGTQVQRNPSAVAHLWVAPSVPETTPRADSGGSPDLESRIATLREL